MKSREPHLNRNLHALPVVDATIIPAKFNGVAMRVLARDAIEQTHDTALEQ